MGGGHTVRQGREVDRIPYLRNRFGPDRQRDTDQAGAARRAVAGFRTEFFIKTGLVLLGASINLKVLVTAAGPAIIQALLLISIVFGFTWWLGGRLGLDDKLRALLASAVSICGVSAAIAAAGAVQAKREQLAYAASLVIAFALPSIFLLPWLADVFEPVGCRRRRVDRRQHRHHRGGRRVGCDRRRGRPADRDDRQDHAERA